MTHRPDHMDMNDDGTAEYALRCVDVCDQKIMGCSIGDDFYYTNGGYDADMVKYHHWLGEARKRGANV
jgi:hypothetical protein